LRKVLMHIRKIPLICAGAWITWLLAARLGPWFGLAAWAIVMGVLCTTIAYILRHGPVGMITWRNRLAGYVIPWGYRLGRGKLAPITIIAWSIWVGIGVATILVFRLNAPGANVAATGASAAASDSGRHPVLGAILLATWIFYGAMIVRQLGYIFYQFRTYSSGRRTMIQVTVIMVAIIATTGGLWLAGRHASAVWLAAAPLLIIGAGFGVVILAFLIFGRNMRWN
jgi:hypothetical protein